jgi:hypothetical protein
MLKMQELKIGDLVMAEYAGEWWEGEVAELNREDKEVCIRTDVQDFWFKPEELRGIPLNDEQLRKLGFQKESNGDGSVKYKKGAFRILLNANNNFNEFEMWYREDRRHLKGPVFVHELQNHHLQMTKVELTRAAA